MSDNFIPQRPNSSKDQEEPEHKVVWPTRPDVKEIYVPTAGAEDAEDYVNDINVLMSKYKKKVDGETEKDYSRWTRSPTLVVSLIGLFLSLCIIFIIYTLIINIKSINSAFMSVRESVFGEAVLTQSQFAELVTSKNITILLWAFVAIVLIFVNVKTILNVTFGNKSALAWLRTVAVFWICVALLLFFYLPLGSYDKTLYAFLSWGFFIIGCSLMGLSFNPKLRAWIRFA